MANTYIAIATTTVGSGGAANIEFTSIPGTYTDLLVKLSSRTNRSAVGEFLQINFNNSATNFSGIVLEGSGGGVATGVESSPLVGTTSGNTSTSSTFGSLEVYIPNYNSANLKPFSADSVGENNGVEAYMELYAGLWSQTSAITSLKLVSKFSATFLQYTTATLYGIKKD